MRPRIAPPNKRFLECTAGDLKLSEIPDLLQEYRKLVGRVIGTRGHVHKFDRTSELQATLFLRRLLENHNDPETAIRTTALSVVLALV